MKELDIFFNHVVLLMVKKIYMEGY
jgi:hypothetical protein